jgi:hypothetical protein
MKLQAVLVRLFLGQAALTIPVGLGLGGEACTPAQSAQVGTLGELVLTDVAQGKTLPQIETDVAVALFGNPAVTTQVVAIVDNLLELLVNVAEAPVTANSPTAPANLTIPPASLAAMRAMIATVRTQMATNAPRF